MRLIDADVLLEQMKRRRDYVGRPSDAVCLVEDAPTIEAELVRRGNWGTDRDSIIGDIVDRHCSLCGQLVASEVDKYWAYCPNCGAKMEGTDD